MGYLDRIRDFSYTAPSGKTFTLKFDSVERSGGHKAAVHELPFQSGVTIQDIGNSGEKFPLNGYFSGADYDTDADAFILALQEKGSGTLHHPRYGDKVVLCLSWTVNESFVDGMGRASFALDFQEVTNPESLTAETSSAQTVLNLSDSLNSALNDEAGNVDVSTPAKIASFAENANEVILTAKNYYEKICANSEELYSDLMTKSDLIERNIYDLAKTPVKLFNNVVALASVPAKAVMNCKSLISDWYSAFEGCKQNVNNTFSLYMNVANYAACCKSLTNASYKSKQEAAYIRTQLNGILSMLQNQIVEAETNDTASISNDTAATIDSLFSATETFLMESDFPVEQEYMTEEDMTPIQLSYKLFGNLEHIDEIIEANELTGENIMLIPRGEKIKYYA